MKDLKILLFLLIITIHKNEALYSNQNNHIDHIQSNSILKKRKIENIITKIPEAEIEKIKNLFENLFNFNELGFTLYGDKPVSFCSLTITQSSVFSRCNNIYWYTEGILKVDKIYKKEWEIWKKYAHLFQIKNYMFLIDDCGVLLVNKKNLKKVVTKNLKLFKKILGKDFTPDGLINDIEGGKGIFNLLSCNHELFGIVLGFGRHNPRNFQRREEILNILEPHKIPAKLQNSLSPSPEYPSIQHEMDDISRKLMINDNYYFPIMDLNRVIFVCDLNHIETKKLIKKYELQRKKIKEIYSKDDWFEQTLIQLISD